MKVPKHRLIGATAAITAVSLALVGCSTTPDPGTESSEDPGNKVIRINYPLNLLQIPLQLGIDNGWFEEEGIELEVETDLSAASVVEALVGGQVDMVWSNFGSGLSAFNAGADIRLVNVTDTGGPGVQELVVMGDSPAHKLEDLVGKKIAVVSPSTQCQWLVKAALDDLGLDPNSIEMTVVSPQEHALVLETGQVDAACSIEPTRSANILNLGAREIWDPAVDGNSKRGYLPTGGYLVDGTFAAENPKLIEAFRRVIQKGAAYAVANEKEIRDTMIPVYMKMSPEQAEIVSLPHFNDKELTAKPFEDEIQKLIIEAMFKWGITPTKLSLDGYIL